ncbi:MAG: rhodanese-like domain-containing protein [Bacteroidota bacterium]
MKNLISTFILLATSVLNACAQKTFDEKMQSLYSNTVPLIKAEELLNKVQDVYLLDTRAPEEFQVSHIAGARLIDYDNFKLKQVKDIPKSAEVIVYCSVGYRSERIGEKLQKAGFENVQNLYGGIFDWKNQGLAVVNKQEIPTDSVHTYNKKWGQWLYEGIKVF